MCKKKVYFFSTSQEYETVFLDIIDSDFWQSQFEEKLIFVKK